MIRQILFLLLIFGLLVTTVAISGCTSPSTIKNSDQASGAITNISGDVENAASALNDISNKLG